MLCKISRISLGFGLLKASFLWCLLAALPLKAQIIPDRSLPENSRITPQGNIIQIDGGTRVENHLFHSFEQFSVPANITASFNNDIQIQNIFSRVTGGSISEINGTIKANGAANLFLINPNGILFGESASLNIGGSFFATTADSIVFADGNQFSATDSNNPALLTVNIPIGLWFRENPGTIINRSGTTATVLIEDGETETEEIQRTVGNFVVTLMIEVNKQKQTQRTIGGLGVKPGQSLGLIGGDVILDEGVLEVENGRIELGSVGENSFVWFNSANNNFELNYQNNLNLRDIQILNGSKINVQGEGGGDVQIQGRQVSLSNRSAIDGSTLGDQPGGTIEITAQESIDIITSRIISHVGSNEQTQVRGDGGNILLNTEHLSLHTGGFISVSTFGIGNGGDLIIQATDIEVVGRDLSTTRRRGQASAFIADVYQAGTGNPNDRHGGNIFITTEQLSIRAEQILDSDIANPPTITASLRGTGNAGNINIKASESIEVINGAIRSDIGRAEDDIGRGGDLDIETGNLLITEGSFVAATTLGLGNAGNIDITATDIEISNPSGIQQAGILAQVNLQATGDAGNVTINTERLTVRDGELISVASENIGNAGTLEINATEVELIGQSSTTTRTVNVGPSELRVGLLLRGENEEVIPNRIGGNLILNTERLTIRDGAQISGLTAGNGNGGNLDITATDINLHSGGGITARAAQDSTGGNLSINTDSLMLRESNITANAEEGRGGNININSELLFQGPYSQISATSALGIDGTVTLNTPVINSDAGLIEFSDTPIDVTSLIGQDPCSQGQESELINTGRGGLPPSPQESLRSGSEEILVELMELNFEDNSYSVNANLRTQQNPIQSSHQSISSLEIVPARGWIRDENGDVILVSYDPTQTGVQRQRPVSNQCQS